MNDSNSSVPNVKEFILEFEPSVPVLQASLVTVFAISTLVFNLVLILAVVRTTYLHTKTNALLVSVSISEVILGMFDMPFTAAVLYKPALRFSTELCDFVAFMTSLSMSSKSLSMLSVSVDRCIAISHPLQYSNYITKTTILLITSSVWSISLVFALFPVMNIGRHSFLIIHGRCMIDFYLSPIFAIVKEVTCTVLPSIAVLVTLFIVIVEARSHHRVTMIAQLTIAMYSGPSSMRGINYNRSTFRALRTYLIITCVYLVTCLPRSIYIIVTSTNMPRSNSLFACFAFLTYVCSVSTPLVITTLNIKFRQSISTILVRKNKIKPAADHEPYTISTGLHTILEHSMVFTYAPPKEHKVSRVELRDEPVAGPSRMTPVVRFVPGRVSVLHEVHSSSSSEMMVTVSKPSHGTMRNTMSSSS